MSGCGFDCDFCCVCDWGFDCGCVVEGGVRLAGEGESGEGEDGSGIGEVGGIVVAERLVVTGWVGESSSRPVSSRGAVLERT